ncbi:MAG: hypothetical protein WCG16_03540 [Methylococcales bacterium]
MAIKISEELTTNDIAHGISNKRLQDWEQTLDFKYKHYLLSVKISR